MYSLIEYINNCLKLSESLWQCCRDEPVLDNNGNIVNYLGNCTSFKSKVKTKVKPLLMAIQKMLK